MTYIQNIFCSLPMTWRRARTLTTRYLNTLLQLLHDTHTGLLYIYMSHATHTGLNTLPLTIRNLNTLLQSCMCSMWHIYSNSVCVSCNILYHTLIQIQSIRCVSCNLLHDTYRIIPVCVSCNIPHHKLIQRSCNTEHSRIMSYIIPNNINRVLAYHIIY